MLEILDNINRSQDYLVNELGFIVVHNDYEKFRQFVVENDGKEYYKFRKYLIDNNKYIYDEYFILKLENPQHYYITIKYVCIWLLKIHKLNVIISTGNMKIKFIGIDQFNFTISNDNGFCKTICYDNFKEFCDNAKNNYNNNISEIKNLECIDDILDKIDCELINELDPMLYKMFMTIFNKPKIKSTNSIHFADN